MNYPKKGQIGFWDDKAKALEHAKTKLCQAGGKAAGARNAVKAREAFERKYGLPFSYASRGKDWLEHYARQVREIERQQVVRSHWISSMPSEYDQMPNSRPD